MADNQEPVFQIQRVYLKEASLEQPNSPAILLEQEQPTVDIQLGVEAGQAAEGIARVILDSNDPFALEPGDILGMVNGALESRDRTTMLAVATMLDDANNLGTRVGALIDGLIDDVSGPSRGIAIVLKKWLRKSRLPDAIVIEHPRLAGGHLGAARIGDLDDPRFDFENVIPQVLGVIELKDIVKGGIRERFAELRRCTFESLRNHLMHVHDLNRLHFSASHLNNEVVSKQSASTATASASSGISSLPVSAADVVALGTRTILPPLAALGC